MSNFIIENPKWKVTIEIKKECPKDEKKALYKIVEKILDMLDSLKLKT